MKKNKELFFELFNATNHTEVNRILQDYGFLDSNNNEIGNWKYLGGDSSKTTTVHSQNSKPLGALVETITNSVDALIENDVKLSGVVPKTFKEAINTVSKHRTIAEKRKNGIIPKIGGRKKVKNEDKSWEINKTINQ